MNTTIARQLLALSHDMAPDPSATATLAATRLRGLATGIRVTLALLEALPVKEALAPGDLHTYQALLESTKHEASSPKREEEEGAIAREFLLPYQKAWLRPMPVEPMAGIREWWQAWLREAEERLSRPLAVLTPPPVELQPKRHVCPLCGIDHHPQA